MTTIQASFDQVDLAELAISRLRRAIPGIALDYSGPRNSLPGDAPFRASVLYPGAGTGPLRVRTGDTGWAWLPEQRYGAIPEGFREETWRAADLTGFLGISAPFVSWRIYVLAVLLLIGLLIFTVLRLVSLFLPNREKKGPGSGCCWPCSASPPRRRKDLSGCLRTGRCSALPGRRPRAQPSSG